MSEIVERLREVCVDWNGENLSSGANPRIDIECGLLYDAADALEARDKTIAELVEALEKCAQRNRYDGDLFHDQGLESRMEASWSAWEDASKLLYRISQAQSKDKAE